MASLTIPSFGIGHQGKFTNGKDKQQDWINKPRTLYDVRIQWGHFMSVAWGTFVAVGCSLLVGAFLGEVSVSPNPDAVGRNAILAALAHSIVLFHVFNTRALQKLDIRVNPYITLADCILHRMIGAVACAIELLAQGIGAVLATAFTYGLLNNTPALSVGLGGTVVNTSIGWAFGLTIASGTIISFAYFHNYYHRRGEENAQHMANAVAIAVLISYPFIGPTTHNPLRWLGACIVEGTCGTNGSWIYASGPVIGVVAGYLLHLETWKIEPKDGQNLE